MFKIMSTEQVCALTLKLIINVYFSYTVKPNLNICAILAGRF